MKYYNLHIDFHPSKKTYNGITTILGKASKLCEEINLDELEEPSDWCLQLIEDEDNYVDFIKIFMDLLEPKFDDLKKLGIDKKNILIWLVYEYKFQCALEFNPEELKRLGKNEIALNIDCHKIE